MVATSPMEALVSTEWLAAHLGAPDIRLVDASWYLPAADRDPMAEFLDHHIPGAVFFDIDEIADTASDLPHTLPSPEKFSSRVRKLGLGDGNRIVVYDSGGWMAAPRVWWMFRLFGHDDVAVLDGGLQKWRAEGRPVDDRPAMPRERHFTARMNSFLVRDVDHMRANLSSRRDQVVDVRTPGRFAGTEPEPRAGLRGGHIPGSMNLPYAKLIARKNNTMCAPEQLEKTFAEAGLDRRRPVVVTCGSGVSAAVLALALHLVDHRDVAIYDGSWSEWGSLDDTPVEI